MRNFVLAISLWAGALCVQPASAAGITYDCQARLARVEMVSPPAAGDADPWQCTAPAGKAQPTATHWFRDSLEYCRLSVNLYADALAAAHVVARTHRRNRWMVTLDADETVLDNSLFERERSMCGNDFGDARWRSWVSAKLAIDVPGAAAFTNAVHRMGGLVAIVTNRDADQDSITRDTLKKAGIWFDYEVGRSNGLDDKTTRWRGALLALKAVGVMWLGDQITDFPVLDKKGRIVRPMDQKYAGDDGFGTRFFLLANPMYGNWQGKPAR
ncbi:MAG: hypothetical protein ISS15_18520 [Alphaproteobacteria bacterium]|nr:hypothetical protein [Alphaproteobacteria bacterium]MBL6939064.1 hypothetical protein [Alphaproteobacteria bacterium]MBL7099656.1 hypothetical protein [Alphaproteobacteria bacterium]